MQRHLSLIDKLIINADQALRTLVPNAAAASQASPAESKPHSELDSTQQKHVAGLMRINHTGEVCAQALYQGQALTAKLPTVRAEMEQAAQEEIDHLVWCEQRLNQLGSHTSIFNPLFYAASFTLGAAAGIAGDKWSLGFVAATEDQVCKHITDHLTQLPAEDEKSRAILETMLADEQQHGDRALAAGGHPFSTKTKKLMTAMSKVMTKTTYRI
ncbi:2-polyprenyl-3-methyl-6-methoxy-1,4-benzoquinone monooxygenase [Oceanicoccus sp. KOV_DT_Chl]|uniref:2-polyprenyl-3-methyl-6-methoxy-1,4-benzoquinone monooxygenase n=1 Tax=Oceanicoccus sp. KOV_DT_Chl TaxID=1904639 RepID=UPI000C796402|nr:2-polyprenyl-3-methyl-6-methoxy-1,4-benzoquinone monooxygenase [Oceanicoccus sp. KOV_DT_Chl]